MTKQAIFTKLLSLTATAGFLLVAGESAKAASLTALNQGSVVNTFLECINDGVALKVGANPRDQYGWQYAIDSFQDNFGGSVYEIYSLALRETDDSIWVAINANMPLTGAETDPWATQDSNIGWGDLFFNFTGKDFTTASNESSLFSVRFAETNDSYAITTGLFGNATATSVTAVNSGFGSLQGYNQGVRNRGDEPSLGDLLADDSYFDQSQSLNTTAYGQYLTGITFVSTAELSEAGYDVNGSGGQHTIAFKFDKSAICNSGYCKSESESVPEPSSAIGSAMLGLALVGNKLRKRLNIR